MSKSNVEHSLRNVEDFLGEINRKLSGRSDTELQSLAQEASRMKGELHSAADEMHRWWDEH